MNGPINLQRPRLAARLGASLDAGSVLLVAPAGYGKTTALQDALEERAGALAWVRCSEADRDPGRLLKHIVATLTQAAPGVADPLAEQLAAAPAPIDVAARARELADTLERLALDPLTIAFDDAELLAPDCAPVLTPLLEADSPTLRIAICARTQPPVTRIARLKASGRLSEIGADELAFAPDECAAYLAARTGDDPEPRTVRELYDHTEGWPLGVATSGATAGRTQAPLRSRAALEDYFQEEVLDRLAPELRAAALKSALPRELDKLALEALDLDGAFPSIARADGLFLRPAMPSVSGHGAAYHPLFREFLLERLAAEHDAQELAALRARLAAALDQGGRGEEAIDHWLDAEDWDAAAAAIARTGAGLLHTAPLSVRRWIERLPDSARRAPGIAFLEGRLTFGAGSAAEAIPLLRQAVDDATDLQAEWIARYALADALYLSQHYDETVALADGFDDEPGSGAFAAPLVAIAAAAALARGKSDFDGALALYRRATAHPMGAPYGAHEPAFAAFYLDLPAGRLDQALQGIRVGIELCEQSDPGGRLPYLYGFLALIHEERGEDGEALAAIARARSAGAEIRGYVEKFAHLLAAGLHARAGRMAEAERDLRTIDQVERGWFSGDAEVTRAELAVRRGDSDAAVALAEEAIAHGAMTTWTERARSTANLAVILAAAGRPARARELLDEAIAMRPSGASTARIEALRAWLDWDAGERDAALATIGSAIAQAGTAAGHLLRREWPRLEPLVTAGVESGALDRASVLAALESAFPGGDVLLPFTSDPDPSLRRAAVRALASSGNPAAAERIVELTKDDDADVAAAARAAAEAIARRPPPLVISLFGGFEVRRGSWLPADAAWGRRAAPRLVRLLLTTGEAVPEDALVESLWPERDPSSMRRNLQVAVSAARHVLDLPGATGSAIEARDGTYRLSLRENDVVDTHEFERSARTALASGDRAALETAAARWGGEPLPEDRYEPWAIAYRERLIDLHGQLLGALAERRAESGDTDGAVDAARELVAIDPLAEGAHRRLMRVYARAGRRGHALRQYLECRRLLVDELGVEPDSDTRALHDAILAGDPL